MNLSLLINVHVHLTCNSEFHILLICATVSDCHFLPAINYMNLSLLINVNVHLTCNSEFHILLICATVSDYHFLPAINYMNLLLLINVYMHLMCNSKFHKYKSINCEIRYENEKGLLAPALFSL